ncbi:XRE family transcriptional regulator [Chitinophaga nivalis]|uniref:LexA family transcriptional regulator n=1 Tax=Chitinophaga nivalis TaxID=2991709 RepID=A0ABT3IMT6_9BACT|nr:LexA family transcriptional regulator [Chitinophaga nivalis]MCW3465027.1 LexA family transcriptional regulator [Chitinophaga nivalis]MCW3485281.1 LexA family transcriptional regulator [Chitinophaga nivalis]
MNTTENQRLKTFRTALRKTQQEFGTATGLKQGSYADVERGKVKVSGDIKNALIKEFSLNITWLESGKGSMFLPPAGGNTRDIGHLAYPLESAETPFIELGEGQYLMLIPLIHEAAYAGYPGGYADAEYIGELPRHSIIVNKYHKGQYRAFEIVGDSMDDNTKQSIPDGSIVTGREIQQSYWTSKFHTHRFKDYIIVHKTDGITTKRITHHDVEKGIITCHSLNPDKNMYPDFEIHLKDVQQLFNIVNVSQAR